MDKRGLVVGIVATVLLLGAADRSSGVIVQFSLDGENPAPDELDVVPGDVLGMYVVSYSSGEEYWKAISALSPAIIENVQALPEAGDLASVTDLSHWASWDPTLRFYMFELHAEDSGGNILVGTNFAFDIKIAGDAGPGETMCLYLEDPVTVDDMIIFNIIPEPGTVALLSLGGLAAIRRRRMR